MKRSDLPDLIAASIILMFTYAAVSKLLNITSFRLQMFGQRVPRWSVIPLVYTLPALELLTALSLLFRRTRLIGLYSSVSFMTLFTLYVGLAMTGIFGDIPCSCGGIIKQLTWPQHFVFNLFFLSISIYGALLGYRERRFIGR